MSDNASAIIERTVRVDDMRLRVLEGGSGPTVLLVAGWPQSVHAWRSVMPALAMRRRMVAVDPPGLGLSDPSPDGAGTGQVAAVFDRLVTELGIDRFDFVGHDIGAWLGYAYAARFAAKVRRLVLIDAAIPGATPDEVYRLTPASAHKTWHFAFNFLPDLAETLIIGRERVFLEWLFRVKSARLEAIGPDDLDEYVRLYSRPGAVTAAWAYYRSLFTSIEQNRTTAAAGKLNMPVLAVGGAQGLGTAMEPMARAVADNVTGVVIANCGHYVPEEAPEALLAHLDAFLDIGGL